jgi:pheromone shutdown protein TraB
MRKPAALLLATALTACVVSAAHAAPEAAPAPTAVTAPAPAPAAAVTAPAPKGPADELDNPLDHPADAYADLVAAKRSGGWALALLAGLVMLARMAVRLPGGIGAWLGVGTRATVVAVVTAGAVAAYDALALGGRLSSVLFAVVGAALALMMPHTAKPEVA